MNLDEFEILFKEQKFYFYKFIKEEKSIKCNINGGSAQPLREMIDIVNLLNKLNIKHILYDQNNIIIEL
jgi:hypothetical protein